MNLVATLEAMLEAGATAEMLLAVVRRHESELERARQERRDGDAKRQREHRTRHAESRDVTVTSRDSRGPSPHVGGRSAQVVTSSLSSLPSEVQKEVGGGGGECASARSDDWPDGTASIHAKRLVADVASPWLDPHKQLALNTTEGRLAAWRAAGASWEHDVVPVVTAICAKQRSLIASWKFFDQAIARSISDNRAALEIPAHQPRATGPPSLTDRIAAEHAEARRRALAS